MITTASENTKLTLEETPIIVADVNNHDSLVEMASQGKVVINCVGPVSMNMINSYVYFTSISC